MSREYSFPVSQYIKYLFYLGAKVCHFLALADSDLSPEDLGQVLEEESLAMEARSVEQETLLAEDALVEMGGEGVSEVF